MEKVVNRCLWLQGKYQGNGMLLYLILNIKHNCKLFFTLNDLLNHQTLGWSEEKFSLQITSYTNDSVPLFSQIKYYTCECAVPISKL